MAEIDDVFIILGFIIVLGWLWTIPRETIYNSVVSIVVALIVAGVLIGRRKRRSE